MSADNQFQSVKHIRFFYAGLPQAQVNPPWEEASLRVLFVRLSPFADAIRSTPHTVLFAWMREILGFRALGDFAFLPDARQRRMLEESATPWMCGVQTGRPALDFDVICISCSVLQELPHLPLMLLRAHWPLHAKARRENGFLPPLFVGGSSASLVRGLFFPDGDSFVDGVYIGEIEPYARVFFETIQQTHTAGTETVIRELAQRIPCFYPVHLQDFPNKSTVVFPETSRVFVPWEQWTPVVFDSPMADTVRLEISRGCPAFCSFCYEAWQRRPYRELPVDVILETARRFARETGASTVEVSAFNFNTHQEMAALLEGLHRIFDRVHVMSQRADVLARHSWMLPLELAAEKRSFTLGVEGISQRMRNFAFCRQLSAVSRKQGRDLGLRVVFSAGFLVRMPQTPLQFDSPELNRPHLEFLALRMEKIVTEQGLEFRMAMSWEEYILGQALAFPSSHTAFLLEEAAQQGWLCDKGVPRELAKRLAEDLRAFLQAPTFVQEQTQLFHDAAKKRACETKDMTCCPTVVDVGQTISCRNCNACRNSAEREFLKNHVMAEPPPATLTALTEWIRCKRKMRPVYVKVMIPEHFAGVAKETLEAHLQAAVLRKNSELIGKLFRIREELWTHPVWERRVGSGWCGMTVLGIYGVVSDVVAFLSAELQSVCRVLESFLGTLVVVLPSFDASQVTSVRASITWETVSHQRLQIVQEWLASLRISFTEKRLKSQGSESRREFVISPRDLRKHIVQRVIVHTTPLSQDVVRIEVLVEGGHKWNPSFLISRISSPSLACITNFESRFS